MPELTSTREVAFPDGLIDVIKNYNERQIRRRVYVFANGEYLAPDRCYEIDSKGLRKLSLPLEDGDVLTMAIPQSDERWYYTISGGWCRM